MILYIVQYCACLENMSMHIQATIQLLIYYILFIESHLQTNQKMCIESTLDKPNTLSLLCDPFLMALSWLTPFPDYALKTHLPFLMAKYPFPDGC